uniref:Uncharacterized protein n=1 Tax=Anopheles arabiensis TaxID=7173 RepID=A0A182IGN7_ANOAR
MCKGIRGTVVRASCNSHSTDFTLSLISVA